MIEITNKRIYKILSLITLSLGIYISFLTASRSGLVFTGFIGVIYWMFIFDKFNKSFRIIKFIFTLCFILIVSKLVFETYSNSYLRNRVEQSSVNGDSRILIAEKALNVFFDHPLTGVGPGQFSLYSSKYVYTHNSFLEAATNLGILGLLLVGFLFFLPIFKTLKKRNFKISSLRLTSLLYFVFFMFYNFFYVFYWSVPEMMFFFLSIHLLKENLVIRNNQ